MVIIFEKGLFCFVGTICNIQCSVRCGDYISHLLTTYSICKLFLKWELCKYFLKLSNAKETATCITHISETF